MKFRDGAFYKATIKPRFKSWAGVFFKREYSVLGKVKKAKQFKSGYCFQVAPYFNENWCMEYIRKFYTLRRLSKLELILMRY